MMTKIVVLSAVGLAFIHAGLNVAGISAPDAVWHVIPWGAR